VVSDACVGTDVGVGADYAVVADDGGATDGDSAVDYCVFADSDVVGYGGGIFHGSAVIGLQVVEDELIGLQEVFWSACVLPPALDFLYLNLGPGLEEDLDGVCDLQFSSPGGFDLFYGVEDLVVEDVDADEGPVADGLLGLPAWGWVL
jgi:hypothetical protein